MTPDERKARRSQLMAEIRARRMEVACLDAEAAAERIQKITALNARIDERERRRREAELDRRNPRPFSERGERDDEGNAA